MFTDSVDVGVKGYAIEVPIQLASDIDDCSRIGKSPEYVVACFNRAHRINCQERSGARDVVRTAIAGKSNVVTATPEFKAKLVTNVIDAITKWLEAPGARRAPVAAPAVLKVDPTKKTFSLADLQKMAAEQGLKLVTE